MKSTPLCNEHGEEPEEEQFVSVRDTPLKITNDLQTIQQLRRKRQHVARAFLRLRNRNGHRKAKRALRRKLCRMCRLQAEGWEVLL